MENIKNQLIIAASVQIIALECVCISMKGEFDDVLKGALGSVVKCIWQYIEGAFWWYGEGDNMLCPSLVVLCHFIARVDR